MVYEIKSRCVNETAYDHLLDILEEFNEFFTENFNLTLVYRANESEKKFALHQFLRDQCCKKHEYIKRIKAVSVALQSCARDDEIFAISTGANILNKSVEYVCYKGGRRLSVFFLRDSYECLTNNSQAIRECNVDVFDANTFIKCKEYWELQKCVVSAIEKCDPITPINMVYAFMKNIYLHLQCNKTL
ncbi:hypothetical protein FQR65_LT12210 [Abscondita terminalis]|nr:hypothetical protein FQR65_LT12210 [Abscondita terminalis]